MVIPKDIPVNELISGLIAVLITGAIVVLALLGRVIPDSLTGAFLLVTGFYLRTQGFNSGVDYAQKHQNGGS